MAVTSTTAIPNGVIQPEIVAEIQKKAREQSIVTRMSRRRPITLAGMTTVTRTGNVEVGVVGEGERKPVSNPSYGAKTVKPLKLATLVPVSMELAESDPVNVVEDLIEDLGDAIGRGIDLVTLHGRSPITGTALTTGHEFINQTTNRVTLGTTAKAEGGLSGDLLAGYNLVVNGDQVNDDFDGFAADKRLRGRLLGAVDTQGRPIFQQSMNLGDPVDNVLGLPTAYSRAVSGKIGASAETLTRAFGGDWSALQYGFAKEMTIRRSDVASFVDSDGTTRSAFQENLVLYLVECIYGWGISDVASFAAYDEPAPAV